MQYFKVLPLFILLHSKFILCSLKSRGNIVFVTDIIQNQTIIILTVAIVIVVLLTFIFIMIPVLNINLNGGIIVLH